MKTIVTFLACLSLFATKPTRIDFGNSNKNSWKEVRCQANNKIGNAYVSYSPKSVRLIGYLSNEDEISTSLVSPIEEKDLSVYQYVELKYRVTGTGFYMKIESDVNKPDYFLKYNIKSSPEMREWIIHKIPLSAFIKCESGVETGELAKSRDLERTLRMSFVLDSHTEGPYYLELDYIEFV